MEKDLKEFQLKLLENIEILDEILRQNKIEYFLLGGSALGAIRHKGFIPWDDDIDIGIKRIEFEKFEDLIDEFLPKNLIYCKIGENKIPNAPIGYLYDISDKSIPLEEVPTIDIFALDNVPDSKVMEKIQNIFAKVYNLCIFRTPARNRGKIAHYFTKIVLLIFPDVILDKLQILSKKIITLQKNKKTKYINNLFGANYEKVRQEVMEKPIFVKFENKIFPIPILYDEYLTTLYGDYMTPPKKDNQKPKHKEFKKKGDQL